MKNIKLDSGDKLGAIASRYLANRYEEQCEKFPKTREIPKTIYISRNHEDAMKNILNQYRKE